MENIQFQKHILERVQKLEEKSFGGTQEQKYGSAREEAKAITDGKAPAHFIGDRTRESALQRVKSFEQNYDTGSVNALHGAEIQKYEREKTICKMLIDKYDISKDEVKA
jgi:hypothetical protein